MRFKSSVGRTTIALTLAIALAIWFTAISARGKEKIEAKIKAPSALVWPAAPETPRIEFLTSFASPKDLKLKRQSFLKKIVKKIVGLEDRDPHMVNPYGLATDSHGRLIAVDSKLRLVHVFDLNKKTYSSIEAPQKEPFVSPIGLALDSEDNIYISDSYRGEIFVFDPQGKVKNVIGRPEGIFKRPTGIAIDKAQRVLYVVDTLRNEVVATDLGGHTLFRFGKRGDGNGEFNFPTQICFRDNRVYVVDTLNSRVQIFDGKGNFIATWGRLGDGAGDLDKPKGVALDSEGHIYIVEGIHDVVQVFDRTGSFLLSFGETGSKLGQFYLPTAIHIDAEDKIYVADSYNSRIEVFRYLKQNDATSN